MATRVVHLNEEAAVGGGGLSTNLQSVAGDGPAKGPCPDVGTSMGACQGMSQEKDYGC